MFHHANLFLFISEQYLRMLIINFATIKQQLILQTIHCIYRNLSYPFKYLSLNSTLMIIIKRFLTIIIYFRNVVTSPLLGKFWKRGTHVIKQGKKEKNRSFNLLCRKHEFRLINLCPKLLPGVLYFCVAKYKITRAR